MVFDASAYKNIRNNYPDLFSSTSDSSSSITFINAKHPYIVDSIRPAPPKPTNEPLQAYIDKQYLQQPIEHYTRFTASSYNPDMPLLFVFLPAFNQSRFITAFEELEEVSRTYWYKINFVWMDQREGLPLMYLFGLKLADGMLVAMQSGRQFGSKMFAIQTAADVDAVKLFIKRYYGKELVNLADDSRNRVFKKQRILEAALNQTSSVTSDQLEKQITSK